MTYLEAVNSVLRRLRQSQVTSLASSDYSLMIGELINETKREVEDAWMWQTLRTSLQIDTIAGTISYALAGAGNRFKILNVYDQTNGGYLRRGTDIEVTEELRKGIQGIPNKFDLNGLDANGDMYIDLSPEPDAAYRIYVDAYIPQADLSADDTQILAPYWPIVLGAYAKAVAERGEDQGRTSGEAFGSYNAALADAIAIDASQSSGEDTWDAGYNYSTVFNNG